TTLPRSGSPGTGWSGTVPRATAFARSCSSCTPRTSASWCACISAVWMAEYGGRGSTGPPPNRAVVSDDGHTIRLTVYVAGVAEPVGVAELPLEAAVRLAADLTAACSAHLARERSE